MTISNYQTVCKPELGVASQFTVVEPLKLRLTAFQGLLMKSTQSLQALNRKVNLVLLFTLLWSVTPHAVVGTDAAAGMQSDDPIGPDRKVRSHYGSCFVDSHLIFVELRVLFSPPVAHPDTCRLWFKRVPWERSGVLTMT